MRFINYDKLHNAIYKKIIEYTPHALKNDYMRGCADGLHLALYVIECQDKFVSWDSKKKLLKLLQPEHMDCLQKRIDTIVPDRGFCSKAERRGEQDG